MTRILVINKHVKDFLGGSEIQSDTIAINLNKNFNNIGYLCIEGKKKDKKSYQLINCKNNFISIMKNIFIFNPSLIYWRFNRNYLIRIILLCKLLNIKLIFATSNITDLLFQKKNKFHFIRQLLFVFQNLFIKFVDGTTVNNKTYLKHSISKNKIYIPNIIDKKRVKFKWSKKYFIWVSNIKEKKNLEIYLKIANDLTLSKFDFLIVGKIMDKKYEYIKNINKKYKNIYYLGQKNLHEVNGIISGCVMHIITETQAGFSNSFIQTLLQKKINISLFFDPGNFIKRYKIGKFSRGNFKQSIRDINFFLNNNKTMKLQEKKGYDIANKEFSNYKSNQKLIYFINKLSN